MLKLTSYLKRRLASDRADSVLVGGLLLIPMLAIIIGISLQASATNQMKTERVNAIQDSASAAVKLTNSQGSLNWGVVERVVNQYEYGRFGKKVFSNSSNTGISSGDAAKDTAENRAFGNVCTTDDKGALYPQYKVTLDTVRGTQYGTDLKTKAKVLKNHPRTVTFTRTQPTIDQLNAQANLVKDPATGATALDPTTGKPYVYRSVSVEVIDLAPQLFLGGCQKFDLTGSAVTFSGDTDIQ